MQRGTALVSAVPERCLADRSTTRRGSRQVISIDIKSRNERLTRWFESWRGAIKRWLSSRSSMQSADLDDVAQEVFLRLLRYSDDAVVEYPQSYLFRIASNVVNEWRERARNCLPHDDVWLSDLQVEPEAEPERSVELELINVHVRGAVSRLPPRPRQVLLLHIREDLTYKQIAARLRLTPRIVRRDIARAYAELRSDLGSPGLDLQQVRGRAG
jgi:RNA polymerase sigma-70 factor (ECF subfamily)